jgi:hypothetical protein
MYQLAQRKCRVLESLEAIGFLVGVILLLNSQWLTRKEMSMSTMTLKQIH